MTVAGSSFSFTNTGGANGAIPALNEAHIIGTPTDPIYAVAHDNDARAMIYRMHAKRMYEISQLIEAVQPGVLASGRVRMALMGWEEQTFGWDTYVYPWLATTYGAISNYVYYIGGAPYPKVRGVGDDTGTWTLAQLQSSLTTKLLTTTSRAAAVKAKADSLGVHHAMYEFNVNFASNGDPDDGADVPSTLIDATHTDPIGRAMQKAMIDAISPYVDRMCCYFLWPGWPGTNAASSWHVSLSTTDDKTIGSAVDERVKGVDDALNAAIPAP